MSMSKNKKILATTLVLMTYLPSSAIVFASEPTENLVSNEPQIKIQEDLGDLYSTEENFDSSVPYIYSSVKTQEEVDKELKDQIDSQVSKLIDSQSSKYQTRDSSSSNNWKTVYGPKKTVTLSGYAGNQVPKGYKFPTGGGFYFSDSGGPSASASVAYSVPFTKVSVSVTLGKSSASGKFVNVPNKKNYFKLYVSKKVQVQPYIVYRRANSHSPWKVNYNGKVQSIQSVTSYAKKVG